MLLFIYGTLKRGCSNHRQIADQTFLGEARTIAGYRLYDLGGYPAIVPHADDREGVKGEVWSVNDVGLRRLDAFEGVDEGLYRRAPIALLPPFATEHVEAYFPAQMVSNRELGSEWLEPAR